MAIPPPAVMAAAKAAPSMSSAFLGGLGSGVASALGGSFGGVSTRKARVIHREQTKNAFTYGYKPSTELNWKYHQLQNTLANKTWQEQQEWYRANIANKAMQDRVRDAKAAGVHPLVAMGLTPASGGPQPSGPGGSLGGQMGPGGSIPSQGSGIGSAVGRGIQTYLDMKNNQAAMQHSRAMSALQVQEQALRNTWLQTQIANSLAKRTEQGANQHQDVVELNTLSHKGHVPSNSPESVMVRKADRYPHTQPNQGYSIFGQTIRQRPGKLTVEGAEDAMGEFGAFLYSPFSILQDIGYTLDQNIRNIIPRPKDLPSINADSP